ncbi:MAG: AAA family ATPase [Candidatus Korobacteraceae bacterium]
MARQQRPAPPPKKLILAPISGIEPEEMRWLWKPFLPEGKLCIVEGDPGIGKTTSVLAICANVTRGLEPMPEGVLVERRPPRPVIFLTAEDGLADTIRPRFDRFGGDIERLFVTQCPGVGLPDVEAIGEQIARLEPALIVMDPLQAFLGAGVDAYRANEVRPVLSAYTELLQRHRCTLLLIRHLTKGENANALYRGSGSIDFTAAARTVLRVGMDPKDSTQRAIACVKSNNGGTGTAYGFQVEDGGMFRWTGRSDLTPEQMDRATTSKPDGETAKAQDLLQSILAHGPKPSAEVLAAMKVHFSDSTVQRARNALGVESKQLVFHGPHHMALAGGFEFKPELLVTAETEAIPEVPPATIPPERSGQPAYSGL